MNNNLLNVFYTNACCLTNKMTELKHLISVNKYDLVCVSETHFYDDLTSAECEIPGYNSFRGDRDFKLDRTMNYNTVSDCGGSVIYARQNIEIIETVKGPDSIAVFFECDIGKVAVACVYRSPSLNKQQDNELLSFVKGIFENPAISAKFCFGDFNLSHVSWISGTILGHNVSGNNMILRQKKYLDLIHDLGLSWLLTTEVTRRRLNNSTGEMNESLLDQLIFTDDSLVNDFQLGSHLGKSDHVTISVELSLPHLEALEVDKVVSEERRCWSKVKSEEILEWSQEIDWEIKHNDIDNLSVNDIWTVILDKLSFLSNKVPLQSTKSNIDINYNTPWVNRSLKRAIRGKNKAWKDFDMNPTKINWNIALERQQIFENCECDARVKYERKVTKNLKHNSRAFFSYLRSRNKVKDVVTNLVKPDGSRTTSDQETAECLADAFNSVFVEEPLGPLPEACYKSNVNICNDIAISCSDVYNELSKLDIYKSFGPDKIHPKLLKALADNDNFVQVLTFLFNKCAQEAKIPDMWKEAHVIALHKKDSRNNPYNYRPVSLTCILCKVYEKFVRQHILDFVETNITGDQHGFVPRKSGMSPT